MRPLFHFTSKRQRMSSRAVRRTVFTVGLLGVFAILAAFVYKQWIADRAQQPGQTLATEGGTISVPDGFTIQKVASGDLTQYPMLAVLDDRGRLFVTESSGKNVSGKKMAEVPECRIS